MILEGKGSKVHLAVEYTNIYGQTMTTMRTTMTTTTGKDDDNDDNDDDDEHKDEDVDDDQCHYGSKAAMISSFKSLCNLMLLFAALDKVGPAFMLAF